MLPNGLLTLRDLVTVLLHVYAHVPEEGTAAKPVWPGGWLEWHISKLVYQCSLLHNNIPQLEQHLLFGLILLCQGEHGNGTTV